MGLFEIFAIIVVLSALFSYINYRYIRLPTTIGLMLIALAMSVGVLVLGCMGIGVKEMAVEFFERVDFSEVLLHGMLGFLLFTGALHVDINDLIEQKWVVAFLAGGGVIISTLIVGASLWAVFRLLPISLPLIYCFVFGALISPTDPIAVIGILRRVGMPRQLETQITGESLFNDGIGVVAFATLLELTVGAGDVTLGKATWLFVKETLGGAIFGFLTGLLTYQMLKRVDNYQVEILLTLALVMGGYAFADAFHISGPIAMVVAGLLIGNHGRAFAMSEMTREHLDTFWELVDGILNAVLFVLIGMEVLVLAFTWDYLVAGLLAIPIVLLARLVSVSAPMGLLRLWHQFGANAIKIMTWGGLRGGISIALALSLPRTPEREIIVAITYAIVVFSILVQGLTIGALAKRSVNEFCKLSQSASEEKSTARKNHP